MNMQPETTKRETATGHADGANRYPHELVPMPGTERLAELAAQYEHAPAERTNAEAMHHE